MFKQFYWETRLYKLLKIKTFGVSCWLNKEKESQTTNWEEILWNETKACNELLNRKFYAKETMNKGDISEERGLNIKI